MVVIAFECSARVFASERTTKSKCGIVARQHTIEDHYNGEFAICYGACCTIREC